MRQDLSGRVTPTRRVDQHQRWKQLPIKSSVTGEQPLRLHLRVSADQEIGENAVPLAPLPAISPPYTARQEARRAAQGLNANLVLLQELVTVPLGPEVHAHWYLKQ